MTDLLKKYWQDAVAVVLFLLVSFVYFQKPIAEGLVLGGHDSDAAVNQGREQAEYRASHDGETTRWTNAMFSGMPTYQIAPSYSATSFLAHISDIYNLGTTGVLCYVFVFLLGFYVMMRAFNFKPYLAALGAIVWAFSSYFFIIIAAGHIWKVMTLAYIPPTIGGLVLCYRGKLLWGGAITALFTAFQVLSNHVQMTYYFMFVMFFIVAAYGIQAWRKKIPSLQMAGGGLRETLGYNITPQRWLRATGVVVIAGLLGVAANLPNLYHTYDYAKHTMRGGSELTPEGQKDGFAITEAGDGGLEYDYITGWSYGVGETWTLLFPDVRGGGTGAVITEENYMLEPQATLLQNAQITQQTATKNDLKLEELPGINQYWGNQPFTVGPVYVGAFIVFLFILGLFIVRGPLKWALVAATIVSLLFAWGRNIPAITHFLIDYLPMYNKFRTVSSALVVAEFTIPLLGMLALAEALRHRAFYKSKRGKWGLAVAGTLTVGAGLLFIIAPSAVGLFSSAELTTFDNMEKSGVFDPMFISGYKDAIAEMRGSIVRGSVFQSLFVIFNCAGALFLAIKVKRIPSYVICIIIAVVSLVDMWIVNKNYLNNDNFSDPVVRATDFESKTPADEYILQDENLSYRVFNLTVDPFNENSTSNWHKNIGGYHAAKLQRYQDLIDRQLAKERTSLFTAINKTGGQLEMVNIDSITPVLNMLNAKYYIAGYDQVLQNPAANGNGWFVQNVRFVKGADAEMAGLTGLDTKHKAVADEKFRAQLDGSALGEGSVTLTAYEPNELHYDINSEKGGLVVFSEVYYPGWSVTIDGQEAELGRVNYVLRALKVPAGNHKVVMTFRPASVSTTNTIAYIAIGIILLLFAGALAMALLSSFKKQNKNQQ